MVINVPESVELQLRANAAAAGFASVEEYAITLLVSSQEELSVKGSPLNEPTADKVPLTPEELETSAKQCDIGLAQCQSGESMTVDECRKAISEQLGFAE